MCRSVTAQMFRPNFPVHITNNLIPCDFCRGINVKKLSDDSQMWTGINCENWRSGGGNSKYSCNLWSFRSAVSDDSL